MQYYGTFARGRRWVEVLATKEPGKPSTHVETGVTYPSFRVAEKAIGDKNLAISRERYGR